MTSPAFLIGLLIINTTFLIREFVKGVLVSKRLEDAEDLIDVKILEVLNLEAVSYTHLTLPTIYSV